MELDDVGKEKEITFHVRGSKPKVLSKEIIMVIKAPTGTLTIFGKYTGRQHRAIKAFMKQHRQHRQPELSYQEDDGEAD